MNITCTHCGKKLCPNDYRIEANFRTIMGPKLYEQWLERRFLWEGMNEDFHLCNDCVKEIFHFIKNEPYKKIKKYDKEYNCPDCALNNNTCVGCPRYRNKVH